MAKPAERPWSVLLALVALTWLAGCATSSTQGGHSAFPHGATAPDCSQGCGGPGFWQEEDPFQLVQQAAGLEEDSRHEAGAELETDDARALWEALARTRTTLRNFGPRRSLAFVLRQVLTRDEDVPYGELLERLRPFRSLVVMRPDGYLVSALTGSPLQRMGMGRVGLREGRLMVGAFEVGAFYRDKGGVFYAVDDSLSQPVAMVGELGLERDWFNAALDGGEDALGEMAQALAQLVTHPIRSLQGLGQLPSAVATLIASSPAYFARYSALPLQEQIREAARLSTHLIMLYGGAAGTAARVGTAGVQLPVLSLTAEGALAIEQVALPVGAMTAAVGTGAGGVYVLMESAKDSEGDGQRQDSDAAKEAARGFKSFTEDNFRENLTRLTGQMPEGAHAHHVFPRSLADKFQKAGINIHDPKFGAWWEKSRHLKNAVEYNRRWQRFWRTNPRPTLEQVLQFGRELAREFGFQVNY
jgi:hypothetical protein